MILKNVEVKINRDRYHSLGAGDMNPDYLRMIL